MLFDFSLFNLQKEKCLLFHSFSLTFFSPLAGLYQIIKLNNIGSPNKITNKILFKNMRYVPNIFPQQVLLRYTQTHIATKCKEYLNPALAFGIIGILQGGIYGHSNLYLSKKMNIINNIKISQYLKGPAFAVSRDIISQGITFQLMHDHPKNIYYYPTLLAISTGTTILSHPFHCMQILNQTNYKKNQYEIMKYTIKTYKWSLFYRGIESRIVLLFFTNLFNDIFLKNLWCHH